ncbi:uncharacterized protein LOC124159300 isoform X2 [Ischnura elegans]|uniref:uncharacterized protein LOC124159300 isoform X2 n=1 Tax=Ischnura elegans TaxID=197161 RepID=UPI001ED88733|nr:uncharacterized protein LOC124159300 isoform X2 [Ischnura elegans]
MRRRDGNTLLFVGDKSVLNPSLLFQFASHWAENGIRVSYLSAMPLNELPTPIHGAGFPSPTALNQIQLLYLPKWHDLLQHLLSLHCHAHVPRAIIVNGLNHYCPTSSGQISTNDSKCLMVKIKKLLTSGLKEEGDTLEFCSRDCVLFLQKFTKILQS